MTLIDCPSCTARNRIDAAYCMRCGKPLPRIDTPASAHARAFAERERHAPFFGPFPDALDFSLASLAIMDSLIAEMWGKDGEAPGSSSWQPSAAKHTLIVNFGAYLGEVLCRHLPARWEMDPRNPQSIIAARVVDAQGRRINPFAQLGVRFRDGASVGLASLYTAITGRAIAVPGRRTPVPPQPVAAKAPIVPPASSTAPASVEALLQTASEHAARGHFANAVSAYRRVLSAQPEHFDARHQLVLTLAQSGAIGEALTELDPLRAQMPGNLSLIDLRATLLAQGNRFDEAIGILDMALQRQANLDQLLRRRAFVLLKAGKSARAATDFDRLLTQRSDDAELLLGLAHAREQQGDSVAAQELMRRILALPANRRTPAIDNVVRECLAKPAVPAPTAPPSDDLSAQQGAQAYQRGVALARQREFAQALVHFIEAAQCVPSKASYLKDVGNCLQDLGRPAEALTWLQRALALDSRNALIRWLLGRVFEQLAQPEQAITIYRAILADPESEQNYVDRAFDRLSSLGALPG